MDWYSGCGIDDLIVPRDGGEQFSDRLPSPDSWSEWGLNGPEIFQSQYKRGGAFSRGFCTAEEEEDDEEEEEYGFETKSPSEDAEMDDSVCDGFYDRTAISDESSRRIGALGDWQDYQLDDIFLRSLDEDLPRFENLDESFCYSPTSQPTKFYDQLCSVSQNASSDVPSLGSSRYLKTHAFTPSLSGLENGCSHDSDVAYNLQCKDDLSLKDSSEKNNTNRDNNEETSHEEVVLCELKMVMNQMTDKTRISFRDALYRLAKNSNQHRMSQNQRGDLFMGIPPQCTLDVQTERSVTNCGMESETNGIDRAIASLMFNNTDFNVRDHLPTVESSSNHEKVVAGESKPRHYRNSGDRQIPLQDDAEVPIFGQMYACPTPNLKSGDGSGNRSVVLDFGSMAE